MKYPIQTKDGRLLHNADEALFYVQHFCNSCAQNNLMNPCSGEQAAKCNAYKQKIINLVKKIETAKKEESA